MKKSTVTKYQVVTAGSWRVIANGFQTWESAYDWALMHDWGQYEEEGGLVVHPYTA